MVAFEKDIEKSNILTSLNIEKKEFILMTMHRPATVDNMDGLKQLIALINRITPQIKIVFPVHPRTVKNLETHHLLADLKNNSQLIFTEPLDYFSFQKLVKESKLIITDSGGIQEESTFLQVPCITLRPNTERPSTVTIGSNKLMPFDTDAILNTITTILNGQFKKGNIPPFWDGNATARIVEIIDQII
jgi:UDP-N-acetylglucosamine 2-epimerase (non-hydrolysing)